MNDLLLSSNISVYCNKLQKIISSRKSEEAEFNSKIELAINIINTINYGLEIRNTLNSHAKDLIDSNNTFNPENIYINNNNYTFDHLRIGIISSLLSLSWGIYDNIVEICSLILGPKNPPKHIIELLDHTSLGLNHHKLGIIRQKYRCPVAFFYAIRNVFIHRLSFVADSSIFISLKIDNGYIVNEIFIKKIIDLCISNYKIRQEEFTKFNLSENMRNQCLLQLINSLIIQTDKCTNDLLESSINTFD